jgi:hypothetical protein
MPCLPVTSIFPSVTYFRKHFLRSLNMINPLTQHINKLSIVLFSPLLASQHQSLYQYPSSERVPLHMGLRSRSFTTYVINSRLKPFYTPYFYLYFIHLFHWTLYILSSHDTFCKGMISQSYMQGSFSLDGSWWRNVWWWLVNKAAPSNHENLYVCCIKLCFDLWNPSGFFAYHQV